MPCGCDSGVGRSHSVNFALAGSKRPTLLAPISANQIAPSAAATRQCGLAVLVGMSYSTSLGSAENDRSSRRVTIRIGGSPQFGRATSKQQGAADVFCSLLFAPCSMFVIYPDSSRPE